ncbi:MAG: hypothetical protein JSU95_19415 [Betaproteobacteria bacterium]|nr:MAG: hypothetical protein JSU95_19415 [Betaproteobacteria bacterium]
MKQLAIVCVLAVGLVGCGDSQPEPPASHPKHALLEGVEALPMNKPLRKVELKEQEPAALQLSKGDVGQVLIIRDEKAFRGEEQLSGTVSIEEGAITLGAPDAKPLRVLYRLPKGMAALSAMQGDARLRIREFTSPEGADQLVTLQQKGSLLFAIVWQRSKQPLKVALTEAIRLVQSPTTKLEGTGYSEAEVAVHEAGKPVARLRIGELTRVETVAGPLQVYVETSHRFIPSANDADQYPDEYVLRAWVVQLDAEQKATE